MELFENEFTLPGVLNNIIIEKTPGYDTSLFGTTESVVIIGTAFSGPVGRAVEVYNPEFGEYIFGKSYDPITKKEGTLMPNIREAWNSGCRTIYAVRVSGKEISRDYELRVDTDLKLRVAGIFPSNQNKNISLELDTTQKLCVNIFKPAERATISEKNQGLVETLDSVLINKIDLVNMGLSIESELVDLINAINEFPHNNVVRLSIVDGKGNDVTLSSSDAKQLRIADAFSGLYTIGRDKTIGIPNTVINVVNNNGALTKTLKLNSDVSASYPIFAETKEDLNKYLTNANTGSKNIYGFATVLGGMDDIFEKDNIDYEEVDITDFDLYAKLGSGFATTCKIEEVRKSENKVRYKIVETPESDPKKKTPIIDGIYSMLENLPATNRVLAGVGADSKIKNKFPKKEAFDKATSKSVIFTEGAISFETVVDEKDLSAAKAYKVVINKDADQKAPVEAIKAGMSADVAKVVNTLIPSEIDTKVSYKEGSLFLGDVEGSKKLFKVIDGVLTLLHSESVTNTALDGTFVICENKLYVCVTNSYIPATQARLSGGKYMTAELANGSFMIVEIVTSATPEVVAEGAEPKAKKLRSAGNPEVTVKFICTAEQAFSNEEDVIFTVIEDLYGKENIIEIFSPELDVYTVEDFVEALNGDKDFAKLFTLTVTDLEKAQSYIDDFIEGTKVELLIPVSKEVGKDLSLRIPYRTDDNFARQLAQHCYKTSIKTTSSRGFLGVKKLLDVSLGSVANKVKELAELRLSSTLVAKRHNGTNLLDRENLPVSIGDKVSICFGQYVSKVDNNYNFVSNMSAAYAGMVSQLPLDQSSTSQPINVPTPMFELTNYQLEVLSKAGFVTLKQSYTKGWVITDGITMAPAESEYKRLSATRISDAVSSAIRAVCEPYIGKVNNQANQNSLKTGLKSELEKLKGKIIEQFAIQLVEDGTSKVFGCLDINYDILPVHEIKNIRNNIRVGK